jgi:cell division protein FtsQ
MDIDKIDIQKNVKNKKKGIFFFILILLCMITFIIIVKTDIFQVKSVACYGNYKVSKEEILKDSGILLGNNIFKEKISNIRLNLMKNPYIKVANVHRKLPNKILVHIVERTESAAIPFMDQFLIIDEEGMVLKSVLKPGKLKVIKGLAFSNFIEGEVLKVKDKEQLDKALQIVKGIDKNKIAIKELDITDKKNILIRFTDDLICEMGEAKKLDYRLSLLPYILIDLKEKDIIRGVIDMCHEGYPNYRPVE